MGFFFSLNLVIFSGRESQKGGGSGGGQHLWNGSRECGNPRHPRARPAGNSLGAGIEAGQGDEEKVSAAQRNRYRIRREKNQYEPDSGKALQILLPLLTSKLNE